MRCIAVLYSKPFENFIAPYTTEYRYITLIGEAGNATALDIGNDGISIHDGAKISSTNNGNISLTGTGKGIGKSINEGIDIFNNASIESTGTGNINLTGIGNNTAEGIRLKGVIYGNKLVTLNADEINLFGSVSGTGNLYLEPQTTNLNIKLGGNDIIDPDPDPDSNSLNLTTAELNTIQNGFSSITIGRSDSTGVINVVGNVTFNDPVTLRSPFGSINVNNTITGQDASITLQGITNLKANLTTNNQNITIDGKTDLGANSTLTGSNVTFKGTINSANSLTVNASGITDFQQAIGGTTALNSLTTDAAGKTQINANVTTTGSQIYNDTVEIQNPVTLSTTNSNIAFNKTVDSQNGEANNLTLNIGTGNVNFNNSVGNTNSLGNLSVNSSGTTLFNNTVKATSLTTDAEGSSQINGDITTTGSQTYNDAVNLQGNTTLTGNNVAFQNTVDGNQALTVNSSGVTHFEKAVGNTTALNSLTTDATGTTEIKDNIKTTGNQTYNDAVTLKGNSTLTGTNVTFQNTVDGNQALTVNASGTTHFEKAVGGTTVLTALTTDATGSTQINGNITTTGNQTYNDTVEIQNPVTLTTTNSNITFNKTVDSQSGEAKDLTLNSGTGNVSFNNSVGDTTALGNLSVNSSGITLFNNTVKAASLITDATGSSQINGNITTTGNQTYNDTVEIQNPVTLTTTNSNIAFDKTVDSQSGEANNLTINSGTGNVSFNDSVGNITSLGNLSVNSGGTTLFNNTVTATSLTTDAEGSSQINGNITTTGSQTYNDAVNLQGNTTLTGNNVAFQNTVDGNQALTVNSSGVTHFEKAVGNTTALNSLTTDATGTTEIKDNIKTTGNQTYNDVVTLKGNSTLTGSNLTLSNVTGTTNNFSVNAGQDIILNANSAISTGTGNVQFDAVRAINLSSGSSITTTSGTINLNANKNGTGTGRFVGINLGNSSINSQTGNITLFGQGGNTIGFGRNDGIGTGANTIETSGNIDLTGIGGAGSGSSGIDLYGGSIKATGTGNINITGTGGTGTENNEGILIYNGGKIQSTSGNINLTGFGKTGTGSEGITARSETGTIGSATTTGDISLTTDTVNLNNLTIQGSGKLTLQPDSASTSIGIGDSATGTFNLDSSELSTIQNGFNLITIGRSDSSGAINVAGNVTFNDPVTLRSPLGSINVNNTITGQGDASITLQGTTNLNANLTTSNQNITIDGNTTLGTNSILTGSNITLSNVTGTTNNFSVNAGQDIILNANSAISTGTGNVQFDAARAITLNSGSKIETDSGSINLNANKNGIGTGYFIGIGLANSSITSQTGNITLFGQGGDTSQAFLGSDGIGTGANK